MILQSSHPDFSEIESISIAPTSAADTNIYLADGTGFAANDFVVISEPGDEKTELVSVSSVSGGTLVVGALTYDHNDNDRVRKTFYDQVEFSKASTITGSKTVLETIDIQWDGLVTESSDLTVASSDYIFIRYKNSTSGTYSAYSTGQLASGFSEQSLRHIMDNARWRTKEFDEDIISDDQLVDIAREVNDELELERKNWSFTQTYTSIVLTGGVQSYSAPTDLAGYESIESVYLGIDNKRLIYRDKKEFDGDMESIPRTVLSSQATTGASSLSVMDATGFNTTGVLLMNGQTVTYSGKTTVTFANVSGVTKTNAVYTEVFVKSDTDQPTKYTVWQDKFKIVPVSDGFYRMNIDYNATIPRITDVTNETVVPMSHLYVWRMMEEIYELKGMERLATLYLNKYSAGKKKLIKKNRTKQKVNFTPGRSYRTKSKGTSIRDANKYDRIIGGE